MTLIHRDCYSSVPVRRPLPNKGPGFSGYRKLIRDPYLIADQVEIYSIVSNKTLVLFSRFWLDFAHRSDYWIRVVFLNLKILHIVLIIGYVLFFKTQNFAHRADYSTTLSN